MRLEIALVSVWAESERTLESIWRTCGQAIDLSWTHGHSARQSMIGVTLCPSFRELGEVWSTGPLSRTMQTMTDMMRQIYSSSMIIFTQWQAGISPFQVRTETCLSQQSHTLATLCTMIDIDLNDPKTLHTRWFGWFVVCMGQMGPWILKLLFWMNLIAWSVGRQRRTQLELAG